MNEQVEAINLRNAAEIIKNLKIQSPKFHNELSIIEYITNNSFIYKFLVGHSKNLAYPVYAITNNKNIINFIEIFSKMLKISNKVSPYDKDQYSLVSDPLNYLLTCIKSIEKKGFDITILINFLQGNPDLSTFLHYHLPILKKDLEEQTIESIKKNISQLSDETVFSFLTENTENMQNWINCQSDKSPILNLRTVLLIYLELSIDIRPVTVPNSIECFSWCLRKLKEDKQSLEMKKFLAQNFLFSVFLSSNLENIKILSDDWFCFKNENKVNGTQSEELSEKKANPVIQFLIENKNLFITNNSKLIYRQPFLEKDNRLFQKTRMILEPFNLGLINILEKENCTEEFAMVCLSLNEGNKCGELEKFLETYTSVNEYLSKNLDNLNQLIATLKEYQYKIVDGKAVREPIAYQLGNSLLKVFSSGDSSNNNNDQSRKHKLETDENQTKNPQESAKQQKLQ